MKIPILHQIEVFIRKSRQKSKYRKTRAKQKELFRNNFQNSKKMIVFVNFADNHFCGGIMTIFHFAAISRQMKEIHGCEVICANFFDDYERYYISQDKFKNDEIIYSMKDVVEHAGNLDKLILHVPELLMKPLAKKLKKYKTVLENIPDFQINVLNQNEEVFSEPKSWKNLWELTDNITQTTGFDKYTTQEISDYYQLPLYRLIGYNGLHESYEKTNFDEKENLFLYSPDPHPLKEEILGLLKSQMSDYEFIEINGITFDEFMSYCQRAKYSITFGEGFDGYFTTIHFTGGIGFTVHNEIFFPTEEFLNYKSVYSSYSELKEKIVDDINYLNQHIDEYKKISSDVEALNIKTTYNKQLTYDLMERFYKKEPTFIPQKGSDKEYVKKDRVTYSQMAIEKETR